MNKITESLQDSTWI